MAHKHKLRGESCPGGSVHRGVMKKLQVCANFMLLGCVLIALLKDGERGGGGDIHRKESYFTFV